MKVTLSLPDIKCPDSLRPHLDSVFAGEYDVPICSSGLTILDLGANVGAFSLWAAHRWPGSIIHAYEPHPGNFDMLSENVYGYRGIHLHRFGVGDKGIRVLHNGKNNAGEASFHASCGGAADTGQHVEVVSPLSLPLAHILKVDTEGCEIEILEPLMKDGRRYEAVMAEYHSHLHRRKIDALLADYYLIGAHVYSVGRGVVRYVHKSLVEE